MARVRLKGRIGSYCLGASSDSKIDFVSNVVFVRWGDRADRTSASIVASTVVPVGWHQGHREGKLELGVLSEAKDVFYDQDFDADTEGVQPAIYDDGDNLIMAYHYFTLEDHNGAYKSVTLTGSIVDHVEYDTQALEEMISVYHIKYYHATPPTTVT